MNSPVPQEFTAKVLELEPFLSPDARKSTQALRSLLECFPRQSLPEIEKAVRSLRAVLACFPGQSAADVEKSVKALLKGSRISAPAMAERAQVLTRGKANESLDDFVKDLKKLEASEIAAVGKALGFTLEGTKAKMLEALRRWVESSGQIVPVSAVDEAIAEGRKHAAPLRALMGNMTRENAGRILQVVEAASNSLKPAGFQAFAAELGITVNGTKSAMKKQVKDLVNRLAVTHVQTQF